jgi:ribose 5-phosphate isomerase RpiB
MIFTARQLEDLHKTNGHVRLPVGARLTPMARDWVKRRGLSIVYDGTSPPGPASAGRTSSGNAPIAAPGDSLLPSAPGAWLWWCDGPCGAAKAALAQQARETNLQPMPVTAEPKFLVAAIKHLAGEIKSDRATGGILLVQSAAGAVVYANRCPSIRAIVGTCRDAVQQGIDLVQANVLMIETPYLTLHQARNVLSLFVRMRREPNEDVKHQLDELASCG